MPPQAAVRQPQLHRIHWHQFKLILSIVIITSLERIVSKLTTVCLSSQKEYLIVVICFGAARVRAVGYLLDVGPQREVA